jgi:phage terminase Nu1 subunit (DNA packaging protein)
MDELSFSFGMILGAVMVSIAWAIVGAKISQSMDALRKLNRLLSRHIDELESKLLKEEANAHRRTP